MKRRKFYLGILIASFVYFLIRLFMKVALIERNYAFVYNRNDLELLLSYADVGFTLLFFISLFKFFKDVLVLKYISIALMVFFIPFSILVSFLYVVFHDEQGRYFIRSFDNKNEYLIIIEQIKGLHPNSEDPRDIYLYREEMPFVYKKIGQNSLTINPPDSIHFSNLRIEEEEISIEINKNTFRFDLN